MKTIQILSYQNKVGDTAILALRDDGSIWQLSPYGKFWEKMPEVREATKEEMDRLTERLLRLSA